MHYFIGVLTEALTRDEATTTAFGYADQLVENDEFDYYEPETARTHRLGSKMGQLVVERSLQANRAAFDQALSAARHMLADFTDEQIYQDDFPPDPERNYWASRYQFSILGGETHDCYLYGEPKVWGGKISSDREYEAAIRGHDDLWVTSINFHN